MPPDPPAGAESSTVSSLTSIFALPDRLSAKADPHLIGPDDGHFALLAATLARSVDELSRSLDTRRLAPVGAGQEVLERDLEIHRLTARLRTLRRFGADLCLGRMVLESGEVVYVGRLGLTDDEGRALLIDWRSPAAEPFFGATHGQPMGLVSRRRYRWTRGRITDYWDEVFTPEGLEGRAALDDQSAFIASLGSSRSPRMRDVLATIQADQDAIIRAGARDALVVDGGPGTGKTVVALHRAAYLLYSDPRISRSSSGILFVGPNAGYLSYVSDVLPSLGEEGVQTCTLRSLVPEGVSAPPETDPAVARLKSSVAMLEAVERAVRYHETPPAYALTVGTDWFDVTIEREDWQDAFASAERGAPHNEARGQVWEELLDILLAKFDPEEVPMRVLRASLAQDGELVAAFNRAWPLLDPAGVVADLWSSSAFLSRCAPQLDALAVAALHRKDARAWTVEDLPLLDLARRRIGDAGKARRTRMLEAAAAAHRQRMDRVVDDLIASDDSEMNVMTILTWSDVRSSLDDHDAVPRQDPDSLAGPFAHIVVDEAQELTDAEWRMLLARCPSRSFTIVGDRAQARRGFPESWEERLRRVGLDRVQLASLTVNYRTPEKVMAEAAPVIRAALPDANVPESVRSSGVAVRRGTVAELPAILAEWTAGHAEGTACVIGHPHFEGTDRIRSLTPELSKGLEFDLVVLVDPDSFGAGVEGAVDRYVAMTRATQQLVILTGAKGRRVD